MNFHKNAGPAGTKVKLRKLVLSVGVALTLGVAAVSAQAGTVVQHYDYGNSVWVQVSYTTGSYNLGTIGSANVFQTADLPYAGAFSDVFTFTLSGTTAATGISTDFYGTSIPAVGMSMTLTSNGAAVASVASIPSALTSFGTKAVYGYSFSGLTAGTKYSLTVSGTDASVLGTNYTFNIAAQNVAAVPEPETYAMLLAGLGLIGSIVRRRKSTV